MTSWDEKNSTEPEKSSSNSNELVQNDTTNVTKSGSIPTACDVTGKRKPYSRVCPKCGKTIWFASKRLLNCSRSCRECADKAKIKPHDASDLQRKCPSCGKTITHTSYYTKQKAIKRGTLCRECGSRAVSNLYSGKTFAELHGKAKSVEIRQKISSSLLGRVKSEATREKLRLAKLRFYESNPTATSGENNPMYGVRRFGRDNPNFGRRWTDAQKRLQGVRSKERIMRKVLKGKLFRNDAGTGGSWYNPVGCDYMDMWSKLVGCNLLHARNVGEQYINGFFADGYDPDKNIWFEYDEAHHYYRKGHGDLHPKDIDRMNTIINTTHCQFWRYNQTTNTLTQYA